MWQFAEAVTGPRRRLPELGIPVTGGNVCFYNQTGDVAIHPTPVVGVLGVLDDVARRTPSGWRDGRPGHLPAGHHPRRAGRSASGRTSCTATSAACRRRSTWRPSSCSARSWSTPPATAWSTPRTTCPTAAWPSRWPRLPALRRRRPGLARRAVRARRHRRVHRAVQRVHGPRHRVGAALGGGAVHRHVHRPRRRCTCGSASSTTRPTASTSRASSRCRSPTCARPTPRTLRAVFGG